MLAALLQGPSARGQNLMSNDDVFVVNIMSAQACLEFEEVIFYHVPLYLVSGNPRAWLERVAEIVSFSHSSRNFAYFHPK